MIAFAFVGGQVAVTITEQTQHFDSSLGRRPVFLPTLTNHEQHSHQPTGDGGTTEKPSGQELKQDHMHHETLGSGSGIPWRRRRASGLWLSVCVCR